MGRVGAGGQLETTALKEIRWAAWTQDSVLHHVLVFKWSHSSCSALLWGKQGGHLGARGQGPGSKVGTLPYRAGECLGQCLAPLVCIRSMMHVNTPSWAVGMVGRQLGGGLQDKLLQCCWAGMAVAATLAALPALQQLLTPNRCSVSASLHSTTSPLPLHMEHQAFHLLLCRLSWPTRSTPSCCKSWPSASSTRTKSRHARWVLSTHAVIAQAQHSCVCWDHGGRARTDSGGAAQSLRHALC